jgi:phosphatidylserine/phosphatidylglycerophosphate/cardiolipin synthase-like enzyme
MGRLPAMLRLPPAPFVLALALSALALAACDVSVGSTGTVQVVDAGDVKAEVTPVDKDLPPGPPVEFVSNLAYYVRALDVIQLADEKLDITQFEVMASAGYLFNNYATTYVDKLVDEVIAAHKRGVVVRVLLDDEITVNKDVIAKLKAGGIPGTQVKLDAAGKRTHLKFIFSEQGYLIGSTNWSNTSISKNNETNLLVRDESARAKMAAYFDKLFAKSSIAQTVTIGTSTAAAPYADGGYASAVGTVLDNAKTRIDICTYSMNIDTGDKSSAVYKAVAKLEAAVKRGVKVRVIMDKSDYLEEDGAEYNNLAAAYLKTKGIEVRFDQPTVITHAKFVVTDDTLVLGSNNWGYGGFVDYHEAGIRTNDTKAIPAAAKYFDGIWAKSTAP